MSDTFSEALSAFEQADPDFNQESNVPADPEPVETPSAPVEPEPSSGQPVEPEPATQSREIDLSGLPEEAQIYLRAREREMTADYTRKTQEAAQQRQEAAQALEFIQSLNTDREFATTVLNHLQENLGVSAPEIEPQLDEYGQVVEPSPYEKEIAELKSFKDTMESQMHEARLEAQLANQLSVIRTANPTWGQDDEEAIIQLGFSTNGDLMKAAEVYQALSDRALTRYIESKKSVKAPAVLPNTSGNQEHKGPRGEGELRAAALERIRSELG